MTVAYISPASHSSPPNEGMPSQVGGFIPPVARRKHMLRVQQQKRDKMKDIFYVIFTMAMFLAFLSYNLSYRGRLKQQKENILMKPKLRGSKVSWVQPNAQPFNQDARATKARHLIVVAGHSVVISGNLEEAGTDENVWYLLDYQKGRGLPQAIVAHIKSGIEEANADPDALLIFSGGETRSLTGPLTEGSSYFRVADAMDMWPEGSTVRARTITEEFATDSFENLLFSICRFKEVTGSYPTKITMVSFTFKQHRFETLHVPALQFPPANFRYVGVDPSASTGFDLQASTKGEYENAARPFENDPYGCHTPVLQEKRRSRNPFSRTPPYELSCPEMKELLHHCGPSLIPREKVPWSHMWLSPG